MQAFFTALKETYSIKELRERIIFTLGLIALFRLGAHVVLPGINANILSDMVATGGGDSRGLSDLLDMFSGGAFNRASIFALGIMPYITASIVIQLMGMTVPYFQKKQKEGESGRRELNNITRLLTIVVSITQSTAYITFIKYSYGPAIAQEMPATLFALSTAVILTAGTVFLMWLGEKITDKGIGNGISLLIMIGIIANLPAEFMNELSNKGIYNSSGSLQLLPFVIEMAFLFGIFLVSIALIQATRKIPVNYAKKVMSGNTYGGVRQYIPLKVNAAGVMPIIFAQALMFLPGMMGQFVPEQLETMSGIMASFNDFTSIPYNLTQFILVIMFTYFYTAILFNPKQMADDLKRNNAFIPGIKPGAPTAEHIDKIMSRILLPGSIFLGLITIIPGIAAEFGVQRGFAYFFGGTSLLILVGVVLDTLQQIDSYRLMRHYDSLTQTGRKRPGQASSPVSTTTAI